MSLLFLVLLSLVGCGAPHGVGTDVNDAHLYGLSIEKSTQGSSGTDASINPLLQMDSFDIKEAFLQSYVENEPPFIHTLPPLSESSQSMFRRIQKMMDHHIIADFISQRFDKQKKIYAPQLFTLSKTDFWSFGLNEIPNSIRLHLLLDWLEIPASKKLIENQKYVYFFIENYRRIESKFKFLKEQQMRIESLFLSPSQFPAFDWQRYFSIPLNILGQFTWIFSQSLTVFNFLQLFPEFDIVYEWPIIRNITTFFEKDLTFQLDNLVNDSEAEKLRYFKSLYERQANRRFFLSTTLGVLYGVLYIPLNKARMEQNLRDTVYPALAISLFLNSLQDLLHDLQALLKNSPLSSSPMALRLQKWLAPSSNHPLSVAFQLSREMIDISQQKKIWTSYTYFYHGLKICQHIQKHFKSIQKDYIQISKDLTLLEVASWTYAPHSIWHPIAFTSDNSMDIHNLVNPSIPVQKAVPNHVQTTADYPNINAEGQNGQGKTTLITMIIYALKFGNLYGVAPCDSSSRLPRIYDIVVNEETKSLFGIPGSYSHYQVQLIQLFQTLLYVLNLKTPFFIAFDETLSGTDPQTSRYIMAEVLNTIAQKTENQLGFYFWSNHFSESYLLSPRAMFVRFHPQYNDHGILRNSHRFVLVRPDQSISQETFRPQFSTATQLAFAASYQLADKLQDSMMKNLIFKAYQKWQSDLQSLKELE